MESEETRAVVHISLAYNERKASIMQHGSLVFASLQVSDVLICAKSAKSTAKKPIGWMSGHSLESDAEKQYWHDLHQVNNMALMVFCMDKWASYPETDTNNTKEC